MAKMLNETLGEFTYDNLVYDDKFALDTKTIKMTAGQGNILRGSVISVAVVGGEGTLWAGSGIADCVLCNDVDTGAAIGDPVVAHAYRTGHLNRQALIVADGQTLNVAAENQLRDAGIYLSNPVAL